MYIDVSPMKFPRSIRVQYTKTSDGYAWAASLAGAFLVRCDGVASSKASARVDAWTALESLGLVIDE
jgi:hypothetical protein